MEIEIINHEGKVITAELIRDNHFLDGYKVVYENKTSSIKMVDLVDKNILKELGLSPADSGSQTQTLHREW